ncbi:hypothetical protein GLOTRDRAFT_96525 [Gloeophyllum trabeum ATCC 11539]|uniref:DUF3669 domain-containing protein n=1 Tax=Gloeophyllum trabeum (strain ATCC 11539 / FP-39264 / Madison 617) TaxID=670483 RepID=S7PU94_GLOTA|nr:uncharacterized protein GLOTRDRAFT_96525 [Gloeophyllum trabeum ATCC 11539]EPQ51381.1 hypothetical protein GLOTRDRAFT_96525 [Gloeophyllum trabeum ATCC 11539]
MSTQASKTASGSYASVYVLGGTAYKSFAREFEGAKNEFDALASVYTTCNPGAFLLAPKPIALQNADKSVDPAFAGEAVPADVVAELGKLPPPAIAMERIYDIPDALKGALAQIIKLDEKKAPEIKLCLLGMGREAIRGPVSLASVLLTPTTYADLAQRVKGAVALPPVEDVVRGIGAAVARIHWRAGYDANDIEFAMGADGSGHVKFFVFDFNKMERVGEKPDTDKLVKAFRSNNKYYPLSGALFEVLKAGYESQLDGASKEKGEAFLAALTKSSAEKEKSGTA